MEVAAMNINNYAEVIAKYNKRNCEKVEPGFKTRAQWQQIWKIETSQANKRLSDFLNSGIMEMKKFRIQTPSGKIYPTIHYKAIK